MKHKLENIKRYVEKEVIPYSQMVMNKLCITDISPKEISESNPSKESLFKPVKINRYQSVKKMQETFYKLAYRIKTIKINSE